MLSGKSGWSSVEWCMRKARSAHHSNTERPRITASGSATCLPSTLHSPTRGSSSSSGVATTFFMVSFPVGCDDSLPLDLIGPALRSALPVEERQDRRSEVWREKHLVMGDVGQNREAVA